MDPTRIGGVVCVEPNVNMSVFIKVFVIVDRRIRIYQVIYVSIINFDILVILDFLCTSFELKLLSFCLLVWS